MENNAGTSNTDVSSKAEAGSVASLTGDGSIKETDNLLRSSKKVKRSAECGPVLERNDVEMETRDDSGRKCSYRDTLTGGPSVPHQPEAEFSEVVSEDDSDTRNWMTLNDYRLVLEGGPWMVANHILTVMRWRSNFDPFAAFIDKATVWIRIPHLPVEYEALHLVCFGCGTYGHRRENCPLAQPDTVGPGNCDLQSTEPVVVPPLLEEPPPRSEIQESYSAWMLVQRVHRSRTHPPFSRGHSTTRGGTANNHASGVVTAVALTEH
ncbi:hypothetical protein K2173_024874 [Erythroxylum novogranatense]|uniref:CCHC-type domain-containing protein n=1 Tax=Erythroxylum novogranatense TaxID=1862640 RepID=A0AAV8UDV6_9ROSI|nr:hypothetical protein K2173_024874 [Erythroxylum novogranatense]